MAPQPPSAKSGGLSLYANLLDPASESSAASGTISKAPVLFTQSSEAGVDLEDAAAATDKQQISAASLRFQPIKRPQLPSQKPKAKPAFPKPTPTPVAPRTTASATTSSARPQVKTSLADWASTADDDDDVNGFYGGEKRQRGGRKKRKKYRDAPEMITNWDDIYDPSRPNNYEEYKRSDEKIREVREWKDRLYAHRMARRYSSDYSDDESPRPRNRNFAPPAFNFAPPASLNDTSKIPTNESGEDAYSRRLQLSQDQDQEVEMEDAEYQPPPPPDSIPENSTGDDAYARRLQMSQQSAPAPPPTSHSPPPPPAPVQPTSQIPSKPPVSVFQPASATISRAPVRYTLPPAPEDIPATEEELEAAFATEEPVENEEDEAPRSLRPGQKGFAERLMSKYGWTKGSGLGATGSGIVKPLQVKVEKQKKKPDSEGGGFATPAGRGKIISSKQKGEEEGKFGPMSEVIVLYGMLDGMDLDNELDNSQGGGLMQEIGEECNEKYGRVERVFIHRESSQPIPVFVKFTVQLSALRAVNALEGRIFNGNKITARFYDVDKFEQGVYQ